MTPTQNDRRCELIEREYTTGITAEEAAELERLQAIAIEYQHCVAPMDCASIEKMLQGATMRIAPIELFGNSE